MADVVIFGTGEFADVAHVYLLAQSDHRIVAFTTEEKYISGPKYRDLPVVPFERIEQELPPNQVSMFVATGPSKNNTLRERIYHAARQKSYTLISHVSPRAMVAPDATIGDNCFLFDGVIVEACSRIGNNTILWSGALVAHHTTVGNHCFLAPYSAVSGCCTIEDNVFLGINSTVRDHLRIGARTIVGAGAIIKKDTEPGSVYSAPPTTLYLEDGSDVHL